MTRKLDKHDLAYNACVDAKLDAKDRLDRSLDDYNRAVKAANSLYKLSIDYPLKLVKV